MCGVCGESFDVLGVVDSTPRCGGVGVVESVLGSGVPSDIDQPKETEGWVADSMLVWNRSGSAMGVGDDAGKRN